MEHYSMPTVLNTVRFILAGCIVCTQCAPFDGKRRSGIVCNFCDGRTMLRPGDSVHVTVSGRTYYPYHGVRAFVSVRADIRWPWAHDHRERIWFTDAENPAFGRKTLEYTIFEAANKTMRRFADEHQSALLVREMTLEQEVVWPDHWPKTKAHDLDHMLLWQLARMDGAR